LNRFDNIDCMIGMKEYEDKHFDLAIVDPPYGLPKDSTRGRGKLKNRIINRDSIQAWDVAPDEKYFNELFRVSKEQIIWGGNYFKLEPTRCWLIWDKEQPWENFSAFEMAWTSFDSPSAIYRQRTVETDPDGKIHPTQKTIKLYKWLLTKYAKPNDKILDTHVGSASSLIACEDLGFEYVGFELDKDYYDSAQKRLEQFRSQFKLELKD